MKIKLTFKTPDVIDDAHVESDDGFTLSVGSDGCSRKDIEKACARFVEWGEYVTIEIDTVKKSCTVVPVRNAFSQ